MVPYFLASLSVKGESMMIECIEPGTLHTTAGKDMRI